LILLVRGLTLLCCTTSCSKTDFRMGGLKLQLCVSSSAFGPHPGSRRLQRCRSCCLSCGGFGCYCSAVAMDDGDGQFILSSRVSALLMTLGYSARCMSVV